MAGQICPEGKYCTGKAYMRVACAYAEYNLSTITGPGTCVMGRFEEVVFWSFVRPAAFSIVCWLQCFSAIPPVSSCATAARVRLIGLAAGQVLWRTPCVLNNGFPALGVAIAVCFEWLATIIFLLCSTGMSRYF